MKNLKPFFCNFVNFKSIGEKICILLTSWGKNMHFPPCLIPFHPLSNRKTYTPAYLRIMLFKKSVRDSINKFSLSLLTLSFQVRSTSSARETTAASLSSTGSGKQSIYLSIYLYLSINRYISIYPSIKDSHNLVKIVLVVFIYLSTDLQGGHDVRYPEKI